MKIREITKESKLRISMRQPLIVPPMTQEQIRILDKPVKDLTEEEAFAYMPLACRLTKGIDYVNQIHDK